MRKRNNIRDYKKLNDRTVCLLNTFLPQQSPPLHPLLTPKNIYLQEKCLNRKIEKILTKGTLVDEALMPDHRALYLLAINEDTVAAQPRDPSICTASFPYRNQQGHSETVPKYGVCFVDSSTGNFHMGEFIDDNERNQLETLLLSIKPQEVVYEKVCDVIISLYKNF